MPATLCSCVHLGFYRSLESQIGKCMRKFQQYLDRAAATAVRATLLRVRHQSTCWKSDFSQFVELYLERSKLYRPCSIMQ